MSKNRLVKYEKILHFQQQQMDLLKQQIGSQRLLIQQLGQTRTDLEEELANVGTQFRLTPDATMFNQQCEYALIEIQKKINAIKTEIACADENLDHLLHTFREANKQLKSWEKLAEQEAERAASAAMLREMHLADERYLATQFAGGQR